MATKTGVSKMTANADGQKGMKRFMQYMAVFNTLVMGALLAMRSVPWGDVGFALFTTGFIYVMSRVAFPTADPAPKPPEEPLKFPLGPIMKEYIMFAFVLGQLLPLTLIGTSFVVGDQVTVREAAPHLFLLAAQVLSENVSFLRNTISFPTKAIVPVMYNARRILNLSTWAAAVFSRELSGNVFSRSLVVANVILWNYNLWGFLLPVFVPWCMRTYYTAGSKRAE